MKCNGIDPFTGVEIQVSFGKFIESVEAQPPSAHPPPYLAPGWIDLQVNGFAGIDYNSPSSSHHEIAQSIQALFKTGVTRFFPTVITGSPDDMNGALRNLADAKESIQ